MMTASVTPAPTATPISGHAPGLATGAGGRLPAIVFGLLLALCAAIMLPGFLTIPPFDRDESRFAQASHQMLASGDYVDIRFQDEARHKKPVGIYWMQAAATALVADHKLDKDIWTFRLPSLMAAMVAVLATAWGGTRLFGPAVGVASAIMMASCILLGVEARMAKTDAVLLACTALAQMALAVYYTEREPLHGGARHGIALALVLWGAVAVGVLVKGPIILMVSAGTLAMLWLWDRRLGQGFGWLAAVRWKLGLAVVALAVLPWLVAITIKTGGHFFAESVGHDMMAKVAGGQEGKGLPPGFYLLTFLLTFQPWSFLTLLALPWIWRHRQEPAVRFAICWIVPTWLVFEAVPTKLLHYTLPTFPAIAMLTARALFDPAGITALIRQRRALALGLAGLGALGFLVVAVGIAVVPVLADGSVDLLAVLGATLALPLFALALRWVWQGLPGRAMAGALAAAAIIVVTAFGHVLPGLSAPWPSRWAAAALAAHKPCGDSVLSSAGYSEPSLVFLTGTNTRLGHGAQAAADLLANPACGVALVEGREEAAFRTALNGAATQTLAVGNGFNYNNGRRLVLTLYRLSSP